VHAAKRQPLTVSIGVATYPDDARAEDELLDKAAWAMRAAKRGGRDRVVVFSGGLLRSGGEDPIRAQPTTAGASV
jgi:PleD family two-component response regulator